MIIDSPISQALTLLALTYILRFTWNCERSGLQKGPVNVSALPEARFGEQWRQAWCSARVR